MPEKRCCTCGEVKPLDEFNRLSRAKDGRQPRCRQCHKDWHAAHKEHHNALIHARTRRMRLELATLILEYLIVHPCVDCGETDPVVLEFDHLRDKVDNVSGLVRRLRTWEAIQDEIAKCEVVCANCHRRRTSQRAGTYRWRLVVGM
ncbi:MAG: hypothetical protein QOC92_4081 [Acidimicrobiaceae bacterium]|jgi:hypothetical protein